MKLKKSDNLLLWHYILECGECEEGSRLKHDMCEAEVHLDVTNEMVNDQTEEDAKALAPYAGTRLAIYGYTTYYDGFESHDDEIHVLTETRKTVVVSEWVHVNTLPLDAEGTRLLDVTIPAMSTAKGVV